jgi:5-methylcytosine-specific restriction endonuclease McrA
LARGGKHEIANLVVACPTCNRKKGARQPDEFAQSIGKVA